MSSKIEIFVLGDFKIYVNGQNLIGRFGSSRKKIALLQYLILNKDKTSGVRELFETLWPEDNNTNPENALKTLMSRLRRNLEECEMGDAIITKGGAYIWNPELDCTIDIYEIERLSEELSKARNLNEDVQAKFERIITLYVGDLLGDNSRDPWVVSKSVYYHNLYLKCIYSYVSLLTAKRRFTDIVRVCRMALEIDALDSKLNLELMTALLKLGRSREAMAQYELTTDVHYNHLGVSPPEEILLFYKHLIQEEGTSEQEINDILDELAEIPSENGALVCDYSIFRDIYHLYMRNLRRLGITMFVVLIAINRQENQPIDSLLMDKVMTQLQDTLKTSLRKGDTISRYSSSQFVLLLPSVDYDTGRLVLERVKRSFYDRCPVTKFVFNYRMAPIDSNR